MKLQMLRYLYLANFYLVAALAFGQDLGYAVQSASVLEEERDHRSRNNLVSTTRVSKEKAWKQPNTRDPSIHHPSIHSWKGVSHLHGTINPKSAETIILISTTSDTDSKERKNLHHVGYQQHNSIRKLTSRRKRPQLHMTKRLREKSRNTHPTIKSTHKMTTMGLQDRRHDKEKMTMSEAVTYHAVEVQHANTVSYQNMKHQMDMSHDKQDNTIHDWRHNATGKHIWIKQPTFAEHPSSGYFGIVFILIIVLTLALYVLYHNKQKIIILVLEGRNPDNRPSSKEYRRLEDAMPSFKKAIS